MSEYSRKILGLLETFVIALAGGALFQFLHIPLAWLLGPLTLCMFWKLVMKRKLYWPVSLRNIGLVLLGYMLGSSFTMETLLQIVKQLPSMLLITVLTVAFSFLMGYFISRTCKVNLISSIIGSVPGGLSQMLVLGEEIKDADPTIVTFMQTFRLMAVIFIIPFFVTHSVEEMPAHWANAHLSVPSISTGGYLAFLFAVLFGIWAGKKLSLPTSILLGPLIATAGLVIWGLEAPKLHSLVIILSQLFVGAFMGLHMNPTSLSNWRKLAPYTTAASIGVVFFSVGLGWLLTLWHPLSLVTAILSTAPGGVAEMGITAQEVEADLSMVSAYQIFRVFFILFLIPPLLKWWAKRIEPHVQPAFKNSNITH